MRRTCCGLLIVVTIACYAQVLQHEFLAFDDIAYVVRNEHVNTGLTADNIVWAFTESYKANWHPLTWLSHMLDYELFGNRAGPALLVNVALHACNALLLIVLLNELTGHPWRSFVAGAVFALHPLHVESVAWLSERKDVLCTLFGFAALWAYVRYVRRPHPQRYAVVMLLFAASLMSKPMLVTLPFVMLLFDAWPLRRVGFSEPGRVGPDTPDVGRLAHPKVSGPTRPGSLITEKLPLFALSLISCIITLNAQTDALTSMQDHALADRAANIVTGFVRYLGKTFCPIDLAAVYPMPTHWPAWHVIGALTILILITVLAARRYKPQPHLLIGWLFFLGTLVPVIGIVRQGYFSIADRFMYVPMVGLLIAVIWSIPRMPKAPVVIVLIVLAALTWRQVGYWQDDVTLFEHALRVQPNHARSHFNLAKAYYHAGRFDDAEQQLRLAIKLRPDQPQLRRRLDELVERRTAP